MGVSSLRRLQFGRDDTVDIHGEDPKYLQSFWRIYYDYKWDESGKGIGF